jgi:hypothetical protein
LSVTGNAKPADDFVIRPATAADRDFLESLDDRLIAEAAAPGLARENFAAFQSRYTKAALDDPPAGSVTLIAADGAGTPLGYIHLEPTEDTLSGTTAGYVSIIAVRAEAEGRGCGETADGRSGKLGRFPRLWLSVARRLRQQCNGATFL